MSYSFTKLGNVEAIKSLDETAKILVEQDGEIKRVPKEELNGIKVESLAEVGQSLVVKEVDTAGVPTKWETANIQGDWNQNDPSGEGYIKNRPFYDERILSTFVEETELIYPEGRYVGCNYDVHKKGDLYIIIVDDVEYESIMTTDDGFPFLPTDISCPIYWRDDYLGFNTDNILEGESFIVKIVHVEQGDITTIPEKYIPDIIARTSKCMSNIDPVGEGSFYMNKSRDGSIGFRSATLGSDCEASGSYAVAEGWSTVASGTESHAEGSKTIAKGKSQHVQGMFNIEDTISKYAHIVGNGKSTKRSNAHTLDWEGTPWYQKRLQFGGTAQDNGAQTVMANGDKELILTSSTAGSTKQFKITVNDDGVLTATEVI